MRFVKNKKSKKIYLKLFEVINATNTNDGEKMILYFGKYRDKSKWKFFVRRKNEFKKNFIKN